MFLKNLYKLTINFSYFIKSPYTTIEKIVVIFYLIKINIKSMLSVCCRFNKEFFIKYKIEAFDYKTIKFLFEEIFYRSNYFVKIQKKEPVIFDCGANIGMATIFFKWQYPQSTIYCFEPDKKTFLKLEKNINQNNLQKINAYNEAVSDITGFIDFFTSPKNDGALVMSTKYKKGLDQKDIVPVIKLSDFIIEKKIEYIDLIKIDTEGSEINILADLEENNLMSKFSKMIIEYHHQQDNDQPKLGKFLKILEKNNFIYQIDSKNSPITKEIGFQDIMIYAYRNN